MSAYTITFVLYYLCLYLSTRTHTKAFSIIHTVFTFIRTCIGSERVKEDGNERAVAIKEKTERQMHGQIGISINHN